MVQPADIHEHMEVIGSDGGHVGRVDHLLGDEIELARLDLGTGLRHHLIPITWVESVEGDKLRLNRTRQTAQTQWKERR